MSAYILYIVYVYIKIYFGYTYIFREVWPEDDCFGSPNSTPEDELLLLREIFFTDLGGGKFCRFELLLQTHSRPELHLSSPSYQVFKGTHYYTHISRYRFKHLLRTLRSRISLFSSMTIVNQES